MKLEEGMYVRTDREIFKFLKVDEKGTYRRTLSSDNESVTTGFEIEDVKKASHNIIDLIEVGDYVNGYKVLKVDINKEKNTWTIILDNEIPRFLIADDIKSVSPIKSIVTKEQFESMSYKVEG